MNSISITGNCTQEGPDLFAPEGSEYTKLTFSIANNDERKKVGDNFEDVPSFFTVEYWSKKPQYWVQRLCKGSPVVVTGRLKQEKWTDGDGSNRSKVVIIAESRTGCPLEVFSRKTQENQQQAGFGGQQQQQQAGFGGQQQQPQTGRPSF